MKLVPGGDTCVEFRASEFGLLSDFGFRVSDFLHTLPPRQCSFRRRVSQNELPARCISTTGWRLLRIVMESPAESSVTNCPSALNTVVGFGLITLTSISES